jgi:SRSO17 transposase
MGTETEDSLISKWQEKFNRVVERIARHFSRSEPRERAQQYMLGLLSKAERKNSWQLAEIMHEYGAQRMQRLLNTAEWDVEGVRDELGQYVAEELGEADGILIIDETGFVKKGAKSAGVARQYSGTAGRIENQQIGVFLAYTSSRGCAFIDRELYIPEEWLQDPTRCLEAGIPEGTPFETKPHLAQRMVARAIAAQIPARWVVADTVYGTDELRVWLEAQGCDYSLAVPYTYSIWTQGRQVSAETLIAAQPDAAWARLSAGEGSQGPRYYDWTWTQLPYLSNAGSAHWLIARRRISLPHELAYYHAYAPSSTPLSDLVRIAGSRWPIEVGFEQAKGEVGLDQYQVRHWTAWYRHMTLALLAHAFLAVLQASAPPPPINQIPLTLPEVHRLIHALACTQDERQHRLRWSRWRRLHQAIAKRCHAARRQQDAPALPLPTPPIPPLLPGIGILTDTHWSLIELLLPAPARLGRPTVSHRHLLQAMLWVMHRALSWHAVPLPFAPWQTVYTRYNNWFKSGLWPQIAAILGSGSFSNPS